MKKEYKFLFSIFLTNQIWSLKDGNLFKSFDDHEGVVRCITLSHDGNLMATGCDDGTVRVCSSLLSLLLFCFVFFVIVSLVRSKPLLGVAIRYALFSDYAIFHFKIEARNLTLPYCTLLFKNVICQRNILFHSLVSNSS